MISFSCTIRATLLNLMIYRSAWSTTNCILSELPSTQGELDVFELLFHVELAAGRKKSPRHEARWLNLAGFCLRPGFGVPGDDARVNNLRTIASNELVFADDLQCQVGMLVLLRRIVGGINASVQQALYHKHTSRAGSKNKGRLNRQLEYENWRLVAGLEHLLAGTRVLLGHELVAKIKKEPEDAIWLWSLGRLGARIPLYGPLHSVVSAEIAGEWLKVLLDLSTFTAVTGSAIVLIARRTDDRSRDIDDAIREAGNLPLDGAWNRRRNHPASVKVCPARTSGRGPQLRGIRCRPGCKLSALQTACCRYPR